MKTFNTRTVCANNCAAKRKHLRILDINHIVSIQKATTARAAAAPRFLVRCENHSQLFSHNLLLT